MKKLIPILLSMVLLLSPVLAMAKPAPAEVNVYVVTDPVEKLPQQNGNDVSRVVTKTYHKFSDGSETIDVDAVYTLSAPAESSDPNALTAGDGLVSPMSNPGSGSNSIVSLACGFTVTSNDFYPDGSSMKCFKMITYYAKATRLNSSYELTQLNYSAVQGAGYGYTSISSPDFVYLNAQSSSATMYAPVSGTQYNKSTGFTNYYFLKSVLDSYATVYYKQPTGSTMSFSVSATLS